MSRPPPAARAPEGEDDRVAGEKRRHDEAGLAENEEEHEDVGDLAVLLKYGREIPIDMQDDIEELQRGVHDSSLRELDRGSILSSCLEGHAIVDRAMERQKIVMLHGFSPEEALAAMRALKSALPSAGDAAFATTTETNLGWKVRGSRGAACIGRDIRNLIIRRSTDHREKGLGISAKLCLQSISSSGISSSSSRLRGPRRWSLRGAR